MTDVRDAFLTGGAAAVDLIGRDEVTAVWDRPSSLEGFRVSALSGHLCRAVTQVSVMLDEPPPPPTAERVDAVGYYLAITGLDDPTSEINAAICQRGAEMAEDGQGALVRFLADSLDELGKRLSDEAADRLVAPGGHPMLLDEYLRTRLVELVVHLDDLSVSAGLEPADLAPEVSDTAIAVMVGMAVGRIGHTAAVRALARRERASRALLAF